MGRGRRIEEKLDRVIEELVKSQVYSRTLRELIDRQEARISDLHNRLMARTYPELKENETEIPGTWTVPTTPEEDFAELGIDENLAGEILGEEELRGTNEA